MLPASALTGSHLAGFLTGPPPFGAAHNGLCPPSVNSQDHPSQTCPQADVTEVVLPLRLPSQATPGWVKLTVSVTWAKRDTLKVDTSLLSPRSRVRGLDANVSSHVTRVTFGSPS